MLNVHEAELYHSCQSLLAKDMCRGRWWHGLRSLDVSREAAGYARIPSVPHWYYPQQAIALKVICTFGAQE